MKRLLASSITVWCFLVIPFTMLSLNICAQSLPANFYTFPVAGGLHEPTSISFLKGDVIVTEKGGMIKILRSGAQHFEDLLNVPVEGAGERGLQRAIVHPNFQNFPYIYFYYTSAKTAKNTLSRVRVDGHELMNEEVLLEVDSLKDGLYHNGGGLIIDKNNKLFLGVGDQYTFNSTNLESYSGKILRLNHDGTVPGDNPFQMGSEVKRRIWSYGLRNPFTMDYNPTTNQILVNDVGYGYWEEINDATAPGLFFGWPFGEGELGQLNPAQYFFSEPLYKYANNYSDQASAIENRGCAITSGAFYIPDTTNFPEKFTGKYFFSDICNGWIRTLDITTNLSEIFAKELPQGIMAIAVSPDGKLYYLNFFDGTLNVIDYNSSDSPVFLRAFEDVSLRAGDTVRIDAFIAAHGYTRVKWLRDNQVVQDSTSRSLILSNVLDTEAGMYKAIAYNSLGSDTSNWFKVMVQGFNSKPTATIALQHQRYSGSDTIRFSGSVFDLEDGQIDESKFSWTVNFHHETHFHPGPIIERDSKSRYFVVPRLGEISTNVWYRIILATQDSGGTMVSQSVDVYPKIISVKIFTTPSPVSFLLDGRLVTTPYEFQAVAGTLRTFAFDKQIIDGVTYVPPLEMPASEIFLNDTTLNVAFKRTSILVVESNADRIHFYLDGVLHETPLTTRITNSDVHTLTADQEIERENYTLSFNGWGEVNNTFYGFTLSSDSSVMLNYTALVNGNNGAVFPNPAKGIIQFKFIAASSERVKIQLTSSTGKVISESWIDAIVGENLCSLVNDNLPAGLYYIVLRGNALRHFFKVVVEN
jgi:glucose/arabinose dehydrogenase